MTILLCIPHTHGLVYIPVRPYLCVCVCACVLMYVCIPIRHHTLPFRAADTGNVIFRLQDGDTL
jgi:hypothetical protein